MKKGYSSTRGYVFVNYGAPQVESILGKGISSWDTDQGEGPDGWMYKILIYGSKPSEYYSYE
ncbi:hypothetical protein D3C71_644240 [compost metagenome]